MIAESVNAVSLFDCCTTLERKNSRKSERRKFICFKCASYLQHFVLSTFNNKIHLISGNQSVPLARVVILVLLFLFNVIIFSFWEVFHIIYCLKTKYIQINYRAIVHIVTRSKFSEIFNKIFLPIGEISHSLSLGRIIQSVFFVEPDSSHRSDVKLNQTDGCVSFVELFRPSVQSHISVDIVFVHGLHGRLSASLFECIYHYV